MAVSRASSPKTAPRFTYKGDTGEYPALVDNKRVEERLRTYRQLLTRLTRSDTLSNGDIAAAYKQVTELACELLRVERAGVWRFDPVNQRIDCVDLFECSKAQHSQGLFVRSAQAPEYFRALDRQRTIAAGDAHLDPRTAELVTGYLEPHGIGALLDAPIWVGGKMVGVVCHEHVGGPRVWDFTEELLAGTVADFVARVIEAADRVKAERDLGAYRQQLEELAGLRRKELARVSTAVDREVREWQVTPRPGESVARAREVFDASPVPLVVTRVADGVVLYANRRAGEFFETPVDALVGRAAPDAYVNLEDRSEFLAELRRNGRVDGFIAALKTHRGRPVWALMTAQVLTYEGADCFMVGFSDVTAQKLAESAVRRSEVNIRALFAAAPVPLVLSRVSDQIVLLANARASDLFEIPLEQAVGTKTPTYYVNPDDRNEAIARLEQAGFIDGFVTRLRTSKGREFWANMSVRVLDYEGQPCFLAGIADVTTQKDLESQLRDLATRDPLTGLYNRRQFFELAGRELARVTRTNAPLSLLMFDADHFKNVNDLYGHSAGDRVLVAIARACQAELRTNDVLARVGGEEFVAMLPDTSLAAAVPVAERLREAIAAIEVSTDSGILVRPTASFGLVEVAENEPIEGLLRRADQALYEAKHRGRDRVVSWA